MRVVNLSDLDPGWNWLGTAMSGRNDLHWRHASSLGTSPPHASPIGPIRHAITAWSATTALASQDSLLVSHGHSAALHASVALALRRSPTPQLAYAFTFEALPTGARRRLFARALRHVDRFVSFSSLEARLYPAYFDLDPARFEAQRWGVRPPEVDFSLPPVIEGVYLSAIGSQGRDFTALVTALRGMPSVELVIVASPRCAGLERLPANVRLVHGVPLSHAMNILHHSTATLVPLRDAEVPCGHGSLVAAMHLGKAIAVTASSGIDDYVQHGVTGLTVPPDDAQAWRNAIGALLQNHKLRERLGRSGQAFAQGCCTEEHTVAWFERYLANLSLRNGARTAHAGAPPSSDFSSPQKESHHANSSPSSARPGR